MFGYCSSLSVLPDISKWNIINVDSINNIFEGCYSLTYIPKIKELNFGNIVKNQRPNYINCWY